MRNGLGLALRHTGALTAAITELERALAVWRDVSFLDGEALCLFNLATAYSAQDRNVEAVDVARRSLELAPRSGNPMAVAAANGVLSDALPNLEPPAEALTHAERALAICEEEQTTWETGEARLWPRVARRGPLRRRRPQPRHRVADRAADRRERVGVRRLV